VTGVVVLAVLAAVGTAGGVWGLRSNSAPLDKVWLVWQRPIDPRPASAAGSSTRLGTGPDGVVLVRMGGSLVAALERGRWSRHPRLEEVLRGLAITDTDPVLFATRLVVTAIVCALGPIVAWVALFALGYQEPLGAALVAALVAVPLGAVLTVTSLLRRAAARRRHFRVVVGSFVDLVVLSLAGGVGIDGALFAASQVTPDWAARRMARALLTARDGGVAPWAALAEVGTTLGVPELVELANTVQLAGTEGARIRQSLTARGASLRRHEQADAESAANAMTERLFFPGALLLLGFLVFIGFPAVHRILGGF
jgi:hypothetical protein